MFKLKYKRQEIIHKRKKKSVMKYGKIGNCIINNKKDIK